MLKKLADGNLLLAHPRSLPGGASYFTPTAAGCRVVNVTEEWSRPLQGAALDTAIAIRTWCLISGVGRTRLSHSEMREIFGHAAPPENIPHVLSLCDAKGAKEQIPHPCILRVYSPGANVSSKQAANKIKELAEKSKLGALSEWLVDRDYGILCLVDLELKRSEIQALLRILLPGNPTLILVHLAPKAASFSKFLKRGKDQARRVRGDKS